MDMATLTAQAEVVRAFAQLAPDPWEQIVVNLELEEDEVGYRTDCLAFAVVPDDGGYVEREVSLDRPGHHTVFALRKAMSARGELWHSFDLVIEADGHYDLEFSYDPPKRLNGILDQQSYHRFDHYAEEFAARRAGSR